MKSWTMILCEGAHDQEFVSALGGVCGGWNQVKGIPNSLPAPLQNSYPRPKRSESGSWDMQRPSYLYKGDSYLEVRALGGVDRVLGQHAIDTLEQVTPDGVGAIVDSNDVGVDRRAQSFREWFGRLYPEVKDAKAGEVVPGKPRVGLWVAPNNKRHGSLDDLFMEAAKQSQKKLVERGKRFITSLEQIKPGEWTRHRTKAILGAINQVVRPGASLAASISKSSGWIEIEIAELLPFKELLRFIEELSRAES